MAKSDLIKTRDDATLLRDMVEHMSHNCSDWECFDSVEVGRARELISPSLPGMVVKVNHRLPPDTVILVSNEKVIGRITGLR